MILKKRYKPLRKVRMKRLIADKKCQNFGGWETDKWYFNFSVSVTSSLMD